MNAQLPPSGDVPPPSCPSSGRPTLICFSHLRWAFVFQRPQHLMSRFAATHDVIVWEEPVYHHGIGPARLARHVDPDSGVVVLTPELDEATRNREDAQLRALLDEVAADVRGTLIFWYYTPMMRPFSAHIRADCIVYDCMDELSAFKNAPPELLARENRLLEQADIVFTGGTSLYEAKRHRHSNVHPFPSSIDTAHFGRAREGGVVPPDQASIPLPRLGFCGVIDERMDLDLLAALADAHPEWSLVIIGPVVKIGEHELPRRPNIHYLGGKPYAELPDYMSGWDIALMRVETGDRQRHGDRAVVRVAEDDRTTAFGKRGDEVAGPGASMRVNDDGMHVVERDAADLLTLLRYDQEAAMCGQMLPFGADIDDTLHPPSPA